MEMNMTATRIWAATAAALLAFGASGGIQASERALETGEQQKAAPAEASIPFVNHGSIRSWRADGRDAVFIQDVSGDWYRATLMGSCSDLPFAEAVGFDAGTVGRLDKFSAIVVRGQRCPFTSLVASAPPSSKKDKAPKNAASPPVSS
jgi:hypothetical protein